MEHIRRQFLLLVQNQSQLVDELDFNAMIVLDPGYVSHVSRLSCELRLVFIQRVSSGSVLVTVLGVEELGKPLVKVVFQIVVRDVSEVQEVIQFGRLLQHVVEIDADLLGDWVLSTRVVQQLLFGHGLWLLIDFVKAECTHNQNGDGQFQEGTEPGASPVNAVFARERLHVSPIASHVSCSL